MPFLPQPGDFGLAKGAGPAMLAVRVGTFSRYGHAAVCEQVTTAGRVVIVEPMPGGCRRRAAEPGEFVWSDVPLDGEQRAEAVAFAVATLGTPYGWAAIAGFVRRWWAHRLLPSPRRAVVVGAEQARPGRLICSELPVLAYRRVGVDMAPGRPADAVSPGDLRQWLDDQRRATRR